MVSSAKLSRTLIKQIQTSTSVGVFLCLKLTMTEKTKDWHLDKTISVGHLISTATILVSLIVWALTVESRVNQNEIAIRHVIEKTEEIKKDTREDYKEINRKLDEINRYLRSNSSR